jgi:hypothetical protein
VAAPARDVGAQRVPRIEGDVDFDAEDPAPGLIGPLPAIIGAEQARNPTLRPPMGSGRGPALDQLAFDQLVATPDLVLECQELIQAHLGS